LLLFSVYAYNVSNNFKEVEMVAWYWLIVAFMVGGIIGATFIAMLKVSRDFYDNDGEF
jgi:hypothetical protein